MSELGSAPSGMRILEIGAGRAVAPTERDVWNPVVCNMELGPNDCYVGVDIGTRSWPRYQRAMMSPDSETREAATREAAVLDSVMRQRWQAIRGNHRRGGAIRFDQADASRLPYDDGVFSHVVMNNVLTSNIEPDVMRNVLLEACRALGNGGEIIIHDEWIPLFSTRRELERQFNKMRLALSGGGVEDLSPRQDWAGYENMRRRFGLSGDSETETHLNATTLWVIGRSAITSLNARGGPLVPPEAGGPIPSQPGPRPGRLRRWAKGQFGRG